jgi:putative ABC transport system substrate-binding protein
MNWISQHLRPFALAALLIFAAASLLLYSEPSQRSAGNGEAPPRVALVQIASQQALDDGATGIVARLAERGFVDGRTMVLTRFNAQGDLPTANDIARRVTDGSFDLIITVSTASAQTVANANRQARVRHVFGILTDPFSAGLGINRDDPLDHPPYMAGYGSLVSTAEGILMARRMNLFSQISGGMSTQLATRDLQRGPMHDRQTLHIACNDLVGTQDDLCSLSPHARPRRGRRR